MSLQSLYAQVCACTTLPASRDTLFVGLLELLESNDAKDIAFGLRELTPHPDDANRQISWAALLGEALTRNTSHVAVDPRHPGYATAHRMLTETPELDKAAHVAELEKRIADANEKAQRDAEHISQIEDDREQVIVELDKMRARAKAVRS